MISTAVNAFGRKKIAQNTKDNELEFFKRSSKHLLDK